MNSPSATTPDFDWQAQSETCPATHAMQRVETALALQRMADRADQDQAELEKLAGYEVNAHRADELKQAAWQKRIEANKARTLIIRLSPLKAGDES